MVWHVFKYDDPSTWPKIDCPMTVVREYSPTNISIHTCKWDNDINKFVGHDDKHYYGYRECYYSYITYIPDGYNVHNPIKCMYIKGYCPYGHDDDGYCLCDKDFKCAWQKIVNEYDIIPKSVIKEFK